MTGRARPRSAAPPAVAFVPGQHRHTRIDPCPAACITSTAALTPGTGSRPRCRDGPPAGLQHLFDPGQPLTLPRAPAGEAARAFHVDEPAVGVPRPVEEPPGTALPLPAGGTFAPQAEQSLAVEDGTGRWIGPRFTHVAFGPFEVSPCSPGAVARTRRPAPIGAQAARPRALYSARFPSTSNASISSAAAGVPACSSRSMLQTMVSRGSPSTPVCRWRSVASCV